MTLVNFRARSTHQTFGKCVTLIQNNRLNIYFDVNAGFMVIANGLAGNFSQMDGRVCVWQINTMSSHADNVAPPITMSRKILLIIPNVAHHLQARIQSNEYN